MKYNLIIPGKNDFSFWALIVAIIFIVVFRATHINDKEISWDVFGYYLPLQATFIENDPLLTNADWVHKTVKDRDLAGTAYFVSSNHDGKPMYFFLFGMSLMYSVFFLLGHAFAGLFGFAQDGLSPPYQYALVFGCTMYTIIGLIYLRKVLKHFFSEIATAVVLLIIVFATNYSHHMTLKNLETVNVLFMFAVIIIWNTIRWYQDFRFLNMVTIGVALVLMAWVKPSEILFGLVPFLWGVTSFKDIKSRIALWWEYRIDILKVVAICFVIVLPQILYWYHLTGKILFDSYKNPGVGLDLINPHIIESLFGYRKGWLIYTPVMIFSLVGFWFLWKRNKDMFKGILIPFLISFYIIVSWTEYWYGAGFSNRPVITLYSLLAIPLGYFIQYVLESRIWLKASFAVIVLFFTFLNQFQWWQLRNYILDPYRTTKEFYWAIFLKTDRTPEDQKLLLVNRDFSGVQHMDHPELYSSRRFSIDKEFTSKKKEFEFDKRIPYFKLTERDHAWIECKFDYKLNEENSELSLCMKFERSNGFYGESYNKLENPKVGEWQSKSVMYLTPEIRNVSDVLQVFFWNQSKADFEIRNFEIRIHEENWRVIKR